MIRSIVIYSEDDFVQMRKACRLAAEVLDYITPFVVPEVSTGALDRLCHDFIMDHDAYPATLNYKGYTKSSCISVNHVVCHGIPDDAKKIRPGDILNIDITVNFEGWYGDNSRMYWCGDKISRQGELLTQVTYQAMMRGIEAVKPGATLGDVGHAIQTYSEAKRFSVVRDFCGHGIGRNFHEAPSVMHFGNPGEGLKLEAGMIFTIEPMINCGTYEVLVLADGWTAITKDRKPSAQFEHTVGVTKDGVEIFTLSPQQLHYPPYKIQD